MREWAERMRDSMGVWAERMEEMVEMERPFWIEGGREEGDRRERECGRGLGRKNYLACDLEGRTRFVFRGTLPSVL